ncbi:MAG: energy transducer TonB [Melioribacteraceae bacterium]
MKFIILSLYLLLFISSCSNRKGKVEIIPNQEWDYLDDKQITEPAIPTNKNFEKELNVTMLKLVKNWYSRNGKQHGYYPISLTIFIGETGRVEKIKDAKKYPISNIVLAVKKFPGSLMIFDSDKKVLKEILPEVEKWVFTPANFIGKTVKYKKTFSTLFKIDSLTNGKFIVERSKFNFFRNYAHNYFMAVEQMPAPIGGVRGIQKRIHYPGIAKQAGIEGRVFLKAFINENGNVDTTEIIKGIGGGCDEEAIQAVMETKFEPGRHKGKAVKTQVTIPILFKIDSDQLIIYNKSKVNQQFNNELIRLNKQYQENKITKETLKQRIIELTEKTHLLQIKENNKNKN